MTADTAGGVWNYALELARALAPLGIETGLAALGPPLTPAQRWEVEGAGLTRLFEIECRLEWMQDPWSDVRRSGERLLEIEADFHPDAVHLNTFAHGALAWSAPVLVVGHSCVLSWWRAVRGEAAPPAWDRYRIEVRRGLQAAAAVAAPSRAMLASLASDYGPLQAPRVIPNARDPNGFGPADRKEPFVFAAGRLWDEAKNISALECAAPRVGWPVFVAGSFENPDGGVRAARAVRTLGVLSAGEMAGWLARASIYALPARYEPFGLSVLEAALSGCALVLGEIPSLVENWYGAALFVRPDDSGALESAVQLLIKNETRRRELARLARERAQRFTPAAMARAYLAAYQEIARCRIQPAAGPVSR